MYCVQFPTNKTFLVVLNLEYKHLFYQCFTDSIMKTFRFFLLACCSVVILAQSASAQQVAGNPPTRTLTLEECLKIAVGENPEVQSGVADAGIAAGNVRGAFAQFLPTLSVNGGYGRLLNDRTLVNLGEIKVFQIPDSAKNSLNLSASLNYNIFDGLQRDANYAQSQLTQNATDKTLQQTRRRILATVRSQYLTVLRNKQVLLVRQEDFSVGKKQLERIRAQYEAGVVAIATVYTQEADVANRELAIVQAENDLESAKGNLLTTLGMNPGMSVDFADISVPETVSEQEMRTFRASVGDFVKALAAAFDKRVDFASAKVSVEAAEAGVRVANASYLPTVSAQASYSWRGAQLQLFEYGNQSVGVGFQYNIFDGFLRDANSQNAQVRVQQSQVRLKQAEQRIAADLQNAFIQLNAAEKNIDITARGLKASRQNFDAAEERFKVGAANILDLTTANSNLATAKINRINALYNYIGAQYQMKFALGILDEADVK